MCAALLAPCVKTAYHNTYNPFPGQGESACTRLERYALAHEDRLFIADLSLGDEMCIRDSPACAGWASYRR